jgi:RNA polymerase sigma-70 factor, ECF subfamily
MLRSQSAPAYPERAANPCPPLISATDRRHELTMLVLSEKKTFLRIASSILHNTVEAEDVLQTAFCSAWKAIINFRGESSLRTWFSRIVSNTALMALRKNRVRHTVFLEDNPEYLRTFEINTSAITPDPEKLAIRREMLQMVKRNLSRLPQETRIIVTMHFGRDCPIETITRLRGRTRSSVVSHLHRGKVLLRRQMKQSSSHRGLRSNIHLN